MPDCNICVESFNKSNRKKITCTGCSESFCIECFETYLKNSVNDPDCMFCHKIYDSEFLVNNVTQAFIKRLKSHRENILFDREKAKIPETMELHLEYDKFIQKSKEEYDDLSNTHFEVKEDILFQKKQLKNSSDKEEKEMLREYIAKLKTQCISILDRKSYLREFIYRWGDFNKIENTTTKKNKLKKDIKVAFQCTIDNCKGFVYTNGKCGVCETKFCRKCRCIKEEDHECNEDDVKTVEALKNDSKPCPSCATLIYKISGCNQMWCTQCHTAFDWMTGNIERTMIHNPHYFQWLAQNRTTTGQQNNNINQCGGQIIFTHMNTHLSHICSITSRQKIYQLYRLSVHIQQFEIKIIREDPDKVNLDLRLKWLNNKIDDKKIKSELYKRERQKNFLNLKNQVFEMITTVFNDLFHRILHLNSESEINDIYSEFTKVIDYANKEFERLAKSYKLKTRQIILIKNDNYNNI